MGEVLRMAAEAGRPTVWVEAVEDDHGARAFVERFGFVYASHDARRRQVLAEVDPEAVNRLYATAERGRGRLPAGTAAATDCRRHC